MAKCGYCSSTIIMGGVHDGDARFCNNDCHQGAYVLRAAQHIPTELLERQVDEVFRGNCPACGGRGPVDVHKAHRVWSALILTSWSSSPQASCRGCATRRQLGGVLFSAALGWWGFPWGVVLTPIQITRNILGICGGPNAARPSDELRRLVQVNLGLQLLERASAGELPPRSR